MALLPPYLFDRPWSMAELTSRLLGKPEPHPQLVGAILVIPEFRPNKMCNASMYPASYNLLLLERAPSDSWLEAPQISGATLKKHPWPHYLSQLAPSKVGNLSVVGLLPVQAL